MQVPFEKIRFFLREDSPTCAVSFPVLETPEQVMRINGLSSVIFPTLQHFFRTWL